MKFLLGSALTIGLAAGQSTTTNSATPARPTSYETHYFDQPIDHFQHDSRYAPHTNATFKQRYWFDTTYYKPGGPVFLNLGGEVNGEYSWSHLETGIIQILMEATNGLGIVFENRFYGKSHPFENSTTDNLRFMTTEQTIADNAYFAEHATFPGLNCSLTGRDAPWILYGGSLPGAQTAFSLKQYGGDDGILWGGIAASGTTKAVYEYPEWYEPYQRFGPQDCIGALNGIVDNIDRVFEARNAQDIHHLKSLFGLEDVKDNRDFAAAIAFPLGGPFNYPTNTWQELNWDPKRGKQDIWYFCDNITNANAPESVSSVDYALSHYTHGEPWPSLGNYANYVKKFLIPEVKENMPDCEGQSLGSTNCVGTQNETFWADVTNGDSRSYLWTMCTESGTYQTGNRNGPSLLSRIVQVDYTQQWCKWAFPKGKYTQIPPKPELWRNNKYGGYDVVAPRLAHVDGDQDVWTGLCYHSPKAGPRVTRSAEDAYLNPQMLITGAGHHWETNGILNIEAEPQFIREAHKWEIRIVKKWVEMWNEKKKKGSH